MTEKIMPGWPSSYAKSLTIINTEAKIAICSMWTQQSYIKDLISTDLLSNIAVIGNTYNKNNCLKPMIVNLLSNRNIRYLILCGSDNDGAGPSIKHNFRDSTIDNVLGDLVEIYDLVQEVKDQILEIIECKLEEINDKIKYILTKPDVEFNREWINCAHILETKAAMVWDGYPSGYIRRETDIYHLFVRMIKLIMTRGHVSYMDANQEVEIREIANLTAVLDLPQEEIIMEEAFKKISSYDTERVVSYLLSFDTTEVPAGTSYTYGARVNIFFDEVIKLLKENKTTKRAYIPIFYPSDDSLTTKPCAVGCSFLVVNNKLNLTIFFRSHDIFRGWPINVIGFRHFQIKVAKEMGFTIGTITTVSHSAQIYKPNYEEALRILKEYGFSKNVRHLDTEGYFTIASECGGITVKHMSNQHKFLYQWIRPKSEYEELIYEIADHVNDVHHMAYISKELTKIGHNIEDQVSTESEGCF